MILDDSVLVAAPIDAVWAALQDVPRVARCIPGASVNEVIDDRTYRCAVSVKVGPVSVAYRATLSVTSRDDAAHRATYSVAGNETRGRGGVSAEMAVTASAASTTETRLDLHTDAKLSGIIATLGGRLIDGVAKRITADFARNLAEMLQ